MIKTVRLLSASYLLCGMVPALAYAQAPTNLTGTSQPAPTAAPGAATAKPEPSTATAPARQITVQAGTGVLLRLPQPAATVMSAEPAVARVQPASPTSLFLMGVAAGRTTVIATNDTGAAIVQYDVTITPGSATQPVTIPAPGGGPAPMPSISAATAQAIQATIAQTVQGASNVRARGAGTDLILSGMVPNAAAAQQAEAIARGYVAEKSTVIDELTVLSGLQVNVRVPNRRNRPPDHPPARFQLAGAGVQLLALRPQDRRRCHKPPGHAAVAPRPGVVWRCRGPEPDWRRSDLR